MKKIARTLLCIGFFPAMVWAQDNFSQDTFNQGQFDSSPQQQFEPQQMEEPLDQELSINENYLPETINEEMYDSGFESNDYYPENSPETFEPYQDSYEPFDSEYDSGFDSNTEDFDYYDYDGQGPMLDPIDPLGPTDDF